MPTPTNNNRRRRRPLFHGISQNQARQIFGLAQGAITFYLTVFAENNRFEQRSDSATSSNQSSTTTNMYAPDEAQIAFVNATDEANRTEVIDYLLTSYFSEKNITDQTVDDYKDPITFEHLEHSSIRVQLNDNRTYRKMNKSSYERILNSNNPCDPITRLDFKVDTVEDIYTEAALIDELIIQHNALHEAQTMQPS